MKTENVVAFMVNLGPDHRNVLLNGTIKILAIDVEVDR